jgi:hypothetical protein
VLDEDISVNGGIINNTYKYVKPINDSRRIAERNRLLNELQTVREEKEYAMIYGFEDISVYENHERDIEKKLAKL